jgi:hypothetical protein
MQEQNSNGITLSREDKIMNTLVNTSMLLMSTFMAGFGELMVNLGGELASGVTEAFSGEAAGKETREKVKQKLPEVNDKMRAMISELRKDIYSQMQQKNSEIAPFMADLVFDVGPKKVDEYDFALPKLSSQLDDDTLAKYAYLLSSEDPNFVKLFGELLEWLNSLPKAPMETEK